jgi:hydroxymethylpyrimidine pyrophosphatase-like HAD family hydrolase
MKDIFYKGCPYTDEKFFRDMPRFGVPDDFVAYYRASRKPVPDLAAFAKARKDGIEVVNLIFAGEGRRQAVWKSLKDNPLIDVTTSLPFNLEAGAPGMDKGAALAWLCADLGLRADEVLACGDNDNDAGMLAFAGIGAAMENGTKAAKAAADFIVPSNDEDGVAFAIERFVLK